MDNKGYKETNEDGYLNCLVKRKPSEDRMHMMLKNLQCYLINSKTKKEQYKGSQEKHNGIMLRP